MLRLHVLREHLVLLSHTMVKISVSQAGLVNNLNDGLGLLPLSFATYGLRIAQIGLLMGIYPGVWGMTQLLTGARSDRLERKGMVQEACCSGTSPLA